MADPSDDDAAPGRTRADADDRAGASGEAAAAERESTDLDALREEVEERYDFDDFGPADMAEMEREEWEAVFDPDTWITGPELIDRVEQDLEARIATREVFARLERHPGPDGDRLLAYSDEGYAIVNPDGSVEGEGTVLRDVEPTVALCSMEQYEVQTPPEDPSLPDPDDVESGSGELGNTMLQLIAAAQILAGIGLVIGSLVWDLQPDVPQGGVIGPVVGLLFVAIGVFLFAVVANARLSDRFRAAEYRDRLRAVDEAGERPEFVPQLSDDGDEERSD
ncbi:MULTISPECIES: DUF7319 domain-containing protein [Halolamina]|uniref:DUF7319 domain-containing protein n=1 Tax=Halolamina pelagica TaxID=699431 RepID=A0A1I5R6P9_9EURY|nr:MULTISPECIES: hypothetical protein [Halolamina]NHX35712.1 hypothetical protein [Halolamina sp. R1-12]SFP54194.1 hypothetical protein SAMN05216277_104266 [Halolamina pelagica]